MKKIEAIVRTERLEAVKNALADNGILGLNVTNVIGRGVQKGITYQGRGGQPVTVDMLPKVKLETVVKDRDVDRVVDVIIKAARTGNIGDGKIFIMPVEEVIRLRTGERGEKSL
ncbi:MAG: P-II family nitrogen regulator [Chloroflexi bacterium]|nr:P-II family nitrogen regulator [Chloroflexota bacterium]